MNGPVAIVLALLAAATTMMAASPEVESLVAYLDLHAGATGRPVDANQLERFLDGLPPTPTVPPEAVERRSR